MASNALVKTGGNAAANITLSGLPLNNIGIAAVDTDANVL